MQAGLKRGKLFRQLLRGCSDLQSRIRQALCCTGHLTEYQDTILLRAACNIFFGVEVHPITRGRNQGNICIAVQFDAFLARYRMIKIPNRHPVDLPIASVDAANKFFQLSFSFLYSVIFSREGSTYRKRLTF